MDFWYIYFLIGIVWAMLTMVGAAQEGEAKTRGKKMGLVVAGLFVVILWPILIVVATLDRTK